MTGKKIFYEFEDEEQDSDFIAEENYGNDYHVNNFGQSAKEYRKNLKNKIKMRSENLVHLLENISDGEYENLSDEEQFGPATVVHARNLNRVVRVRNIIKNKSDKKYDHLGVIDMKKFKDEKRNLDDKVQKTLNRLGPPSFLKTKFRTRTVDQYKVVNGKYLGIITK